jgi:hypothetical protein
LCEHFYAQNFFILFLRLFSGCNSNEKSEKYFELMN